MQIPNWPTDNLYKFMAIFGLIATLVSFLTAAVLIEDIAYMDAESKHIALKREVTAQWHENVKKGMGKATRQEMHDEIDGLSKGSKKLSTNIARKDIAIERLMLLQWSFALGVALMILGFILWYNKVQKYQDIILKAECDAASYQQKDTPLDTPIDTKERRFVRKIQRAPKSHARMGRNS